MAKATKQELETAKSKAVKGGMPQDVADKVIQMAGSKGTFAMQMNKQKNNSADNFSSKDSTMMMQSALYNPGHGGDPNHTHSDTDPNKLKGYTGSENKDKSKTINTPSSEQIKNFQSIKEDVISNHKTFIKGLQNLKTNDSLQTILKDGENAAKVKYNFDFDINNTAGPKPGNVYFNKGVRGPQGVDASYDFVNNAYRPSGGSESTNSRNYRTVYNEAKKYQDLIEERKDYNKNNTPSLNMAPLKFYRKNKK
jgi:hypothetical protein